MSTYQPQLKNESMAVPNTAALIAIGLSRGEAERFATLPYAALPKWVRARIKRALTHNQPERIRHRGNQPHGEKNAICSYSQSWQ